MEYVNPDSLVPPRGYSHGVRFTPGGQPVFVAGQIGWTGDGRLVAGGLVAQFAQALANVLAVVSAAGGGPESIGQMRIFVTDGADYTAARRPIGEAYRTLMGRHYPAMSVVEVRALLEPGALVEIEATAVVPAGREAP